MAYAAQAQNSPAIHRLGLLSPGTPSSNAPNIEAFREGLRSLGYMEGENVIIYYRYGEGKLAQYPLLIRELMSLGVDVIITASGPAVRAAKNATATIPVVMAAHADPLREGLVVSLANPGGNVTGLSMRSPEMSGKRLALLKQVVQNLRRVAILWNPTNHTPSVSLNEYESAARMLKLRLLPMQVQSQQDLHAQFELLTRNRPDAFTVVRDPFLNQNMSRIVKLAKRLRLPAVYDAREYVVAGGLMSYAPSHLDLYRRAALYVHKILNGAKPADLPIEQPIKPEFIVNLKAAHGIGLTIPPELLQLADIVIR